MKARHYVLIALIMLLSGCAQGGSCGCRSSWGDAPKECGGGPRLDCEGEACTDVSVTELGGGNGYQLKNKSAKKVKVSFKWVGINICSDSNWVDFTLAAHQVEEFDNNYCTPYQAVYADSAAPTDPVQTTPKIVSFTITPNNVNVGNSVEFRITLKKPAPSGGTTIGFSSITNSGLTDTIVNMPRYSTINQGQTEIKVTIRTHKSEPPDKPFAKTDIIFTVTNSVSEKSAELIVK